MTCSTVRRPLGALITACPSCGYTYGTHAPECAGRLAWLNAYARTLPPDRQRQIAELAHFARAAAASGLHFRYVPLSLAALDALLEGLTG